MIIANRYHATGSAAWGGMSEVHEFWDKHLDRKVMLKRVKRKQDMSRLLDEKKALLALRSPHVIELLDVVEYEIFGEKEAGLILEFIEGSDLSEDSLPCDDSYLKTAYQISSGLTDIHEAGVIHRDIKPANIRVSSNGIIKIIDFGLARQVGIDNKTRSITGTEDFMAPELRGDRTIKFSTAIDTYAFGSTLIRCLNWTASGAHAVISKLTPSQLQGTFPRLGGPLSEMLVSCLATRPDDRPTMRDIRDALATLLLTNRHRARVSTPSGKHEINKDFPLADINTANGSLRIRYDGNQFLADSVSGDVYVNNSRAIIGTKLLPACVLTFGQQTSPRAFLTFDVSQPEVKV